MTNIPLSSKFDAGRIAKFFFLLFIVSIFFPVRYVFPTASSYVTGLFSDFTSISLYSSDIFLLIAFFFTLWSNNWKIKLWLKNKGIAVLIIWLILATFIFNKSISGLNIWYFVKFLELIIVAYGTTRLVINNQSLVIRKLFLLIFVCLGTLQSIIGLLQFINQSPIGLNLIGEQIIHPNLWGVAKIVSDGTTFIRAYGTFPHPNLFSAFLVATILINIYLLTHHYFRESSAEASAKADNDTTWSPASAKATADQPKNNRWLLRTTQIWLNLALFINILGLTVTFSRGAFLALGIGLFVYFIPSFTRRGEPFGVGWWKCPLLIACYLLISFLIFRPFLLTRTTISDQSTIERKIYNQTALNIIKNKPLFGIGIGESLLHMEQYSPKKLNPWQIQPIHNYFLLTAAELGITGALILIWILLSHLVGVWGLKIVELFRNCPPEADPPLAEKLFKNCKLKIENSQADLYHLTLSSILISFLILMLFDHYFYTLEQTQMLLWVILGLIAAETKNPQNRGFI